MDIVSAAPIGLAWHSPVAAYRVVIGADCWELRDAAVADVLVWAQEQAAGQPYTVDVITAHGPGSVRLVGGDHVEPVGPVPDVVAGGRRSRTIPAGLHVGLSRATVRAGASAEADRWMALLEDRVEECVATLDAERMAVEIIFRLAEGETEHLWWVTIRGEGGRGLDLGNDLDRAHVEQGQRTKEPGWVEAEPQLLLLPAPVRAAVEPGRCAPEGFRRNETHYS